jgi:cobalamin biosynthesis protein CobT
MPRRLRAFLYRIERTLVGVVMKLLAWALERLALRG